MFIRFFAHTLLKLLELAGYSEKKQCRIKPNRRQQEYRMKIRKLSVKIVGNPLIVEKILGCFEKKAFLDLRRVNKLFNEACLGIIRHQNRKIKFEFLQRSREVVTLGKDSVVHVNGKPMKLRELDSYFRFLNIIAKLKVERITVVDVWKLTRSVKTKTIAERFHDDVVLRLIGTNQGNLKEIIGFSDVCQFCHECRQLSTNCQTFGPVIHLAAYREKKDFKKFILKDSALELLANICIEQSDSMESCLEMLEMKMNTSNTTCSTLALWISERRLREGLIVGSMPFPREVLLMILEKWQVKNIELKFIGTKEEPAIGGWSDSGYFTELKFNDLFASVKKPETSLIIDHVHVDLSRSSHCAWDLKLIELSGYENLIANVRRIFRPNRISIDFSHWFNLEHHNRSEILEHMLKVSRMENHQNLTIDIQFFTKLKTDVKVVNGEVDLEIPEPFEIVGPNFRCYHKLLEKNGNFKTKKWIGKRCRFLDFEKKFSLNVDIFASEKMIKWVVSKHFRTAKFLEMHQF